MAPTATNERLMLTLELADFLYREADLLDERRYEEWLDLLADDVKYTMPLRMNVEYKNLHLETTQPGKDVCWIDEGKETLSLRVAQLATGVHWAEEPVSRASHFVSNVHIKDVRLPEVEVSCRFLVYRNRVADETDILAGRRIDVLRQSGEDWKLASRTFYLDQTVLLMKNLSLLV